MGVKSYDSSMSQKSRIFAFGRIKDLILPPGRTFRAESAHTKIFIRTPPEVLQNGGAKNKNRIF